MLAKRFFNIILAVTLGTCSIFTHVQAAPAAQNMPNMPDLNISPAALENMENIMGVMEKNFERMPAAEKQKFEQEFTALVAEEQRKMAAMTPEQLQQHVAASLEQIGELSPEDIREIERMLNEEMDELEVQATEKATSKSNNNKVAQKANSESEKAQNKKKIKETLDLINNIIKVLNSLNSKLNSMKTPNISESVGKWIQKGEITGISSWSSFNGNLQAMKQKLEKLKQADPKTGKYYYLDDIKTIDKLYGQLEMLYSTIKKYEPSIEVNKTTWQIQVSSKSALKKIIEYLADTTKTVTKNIDEIISKFEKTDAPKIKKQEEDKAKKATSKSAPRGKTTRAGRPEPRYEKEETYLPDAGASYYGPYASSSYGSAGDRPDSSYYPSAYSSDSSPSKGSSQSADSSSPRGAQSSADETGEPKKDVNGKSVSATDTKTKPVPGTEPAGEKKKITVDPKYKPISTKLHVAEGKLDDFEVSFKELKQDKNWQRLTGYLQDSTTDSQFALKLADSVSKAQKAKKSVASFTQDLETVKDSAVRANFKDKATGKIATNPERKKIRDEVSNYVGQADSAKTTQTKAGKTMSSAKSAELEQIKVLGSELFEIVELIKSIK